MTDKLIDEIAKTICSASGCMWPEDAEDMKESFRAAAKIVIDEIIALGAMPLIEPPEGYVKARIAYVCASYSGGTSIMVLNGRDEEALSHLREIKSGIGGDYITHEGIVEAWIPPVQLKTVKGVVE